MSSDKILAIAGVRGGKNNLTVELAHILMEKVNQMVEGELISALAMAAHLARERPELTINDVTDAIVKDLRARYGLKEKP